MAQTPVIEWYRGDAGNITVDWTKDRGGLGTYSSLTGKTLIFTARATETASSASIALYSSASQITLITASMGSYYLTLSSSHTQSLSIADYPCDVQASSSGSIATIFRGTLRILRDITV